MKLVFNAPWPVILAGMIFFSIAALQIRRKSPLPGILRILRWTAAACLAFLVFEPMALIMGGARSRPRLAVLLDASVSMKQPAKQGGESRWARSLQWLSENRKLMEKYSDPVYFYFTDRLAPLDIYSPPASPGDSASSLDSALRQLSKESARTPERVWVITDGLSGSEGGEPPGLSADFIGAGEASKAGEIRITRARVPDFAFLHLPLKISVSWEARGLAGVSAGIKLLREDGGVAAEKKEEIKSDYAVFESTLTAGTEALGPRRYRLVLHADKAGIKSAAREIRFQVIREKWRVMYLCGRPSPEYAALREFLKADPNLELISFVILRNPENVSPVADSELSLIPFPAQEIFVSDIRHFDIFIIQNFPVQRFNLPPAYLSSVKDFVGRGGGLLLMGGDSAFGSGNYRGTPLEEVLPVSMSDYASDYESGSLRVKASDHPVARVAGDRDSSERLWDAAPPLEGFNGFAGLKAGAHSILSGKTQNGGEVPLLAAREYGRGKVMVMASPSTWRWKLAAGYSWKISPLYPAFWTRVLQYLSGSLDLKRVQLAAPPEEQVQGETPTVLLRVLDDTFNPLNDPSADIRAYLTLSSGRTVPLEFRITEPGIFKAELDPPYYGEQKVKAMVRSGGRITGEDEIKFRINRPSGETRPVDRILLESLAKKYGGRYSSIYAVNPGQWLKALPPAERSREVNSRKNLRDSGLWMGLIAALLIAEWFLRRMWGFS